MEEDTGLTRRSAWSLRGASRARRLLTDGWAMLRSHVMVTQASGTDA